MTSMELVFGYEPKQFDRVQEVVSTAVRRFIEWYKQCIIRMLQSYCEMFSRGLVFVLKIVVFSFEAVTKSSNLNEKSSKKELQKQAIKYVK